MRASVATLFRLDTGPRCSPTVASSMTKALKGMNFAVHAILIAAGVVWCRHARQYWCEGARTTASLLGMTGAAAMVAGFFL